MQKQKNTLIIIAIALVLATVLSSLFYIGVFSNVNAKLTDNLYGGKIALNDIVIVAIDDTSLQEIGRWPWDRKVFAKLIPKLSKAKVVGIDVTFFEKFNEESDTLLAESLKSAKVVLPLEFSSFKKNAKGKVVGEDILLPLPELIKNVAGLGYVNIITDLDGVSRAINVDLSSKYDSFALELYKVATGNSYLFSEARFLVNFVNSPGAFTRYSASDVLNDKIEVDLFSNKIVLVGASAPDLHDDYFVPTSNGRAMPGVEVHANTLQTMLTNSKLSSANWFLIVFLIFVSALLFSFLVHSSPIWISAIVSLLSIVAYLFIAIWTFNQGQILNLVYVPLTIILSYFSIVSYSYFFEAKEKRKVMNAFSKYVSSDVITDIMKNPEKLKLGGERVEITIFFSDIRGFTTISEALSPEQLVSLLNEYLTEMTNIIMKNGGVVDKYMGDAIMAFWGAPVKHKNHAKMAAKATMEMEARLLELQKKWTREGIPSLSIGSGLNTGQAVVGNMGSHDRFDYTAMGDTINLGSRLEGLNKGYKTTTIISKSTFHKIKDEYACRKLDKVQVKGKTEPITIYELMGEHKKVSSKTKEAATIFELAFDKYYLKQKWKLAIKEFEKAIAINQDGPSQIYIQRCKTFQKNPPGQDWDGVWVMTTK